MDNDFDGVSYMGSAGGTADFLNGRIDNFSFYTRHLADAEVSEHYNGGASLSYPFN